MELEPLRVLVADDHRDTADSLCMLVRLWRHEVQVAYDGLAACEIADAFRPGVLLLDIEMPKLSGFQLAQQMRRRILLNDAVVVGITGYADQAHRLIWEKAFDHYLIKPVDPEIVEQLLLLEQRRQVNLAIARLATPRREKIRLFRVAD